MVFVINIIYMESIEKEIIDLLLEGKNRNQIADKLNISRKEVDLYIKGIYSKFNVFNKVQLAVKYMMQSNQKV